ncbi:MAG: hypothetical protein KatS3mg110_1064 [Pirellulaceae bacterium]|nr:MAG: hypothetical protein KatS3mg110_1064 [Pirellulaceae bacterium]
MAWLDPPECTAARDALQQGNAVEAARLLLASRYPHHRAVRKLKLEVSGRLVQMAEQQVQEGQWEAARGSIELAAQCAALEGKALELQRRIAEASRARQQREAWLSEKLREAQQLADSGQLQSAIDLLAQLGNYEPVTQLRVAIEQRLSQFRRHVEACRQSLERGEPVAAHRHWRKAKEVIPDDPELAELAAGIARRMATSSAAEPQRSGLPIKDRAQRWVLDRLGLVVSSGEVCIGTPRAEGVHVPIMGPIHNRHAVLLRDRDSWQIAVAHDRQGRPCPVSVNGRPIETLFRLSDGDIVQLGECSWGWRFSLPVPGSATAVLEPISGSRPMIWTAYGSPVSRVVLMDKELVLKANHPAHLVVSDLPCQQVSFVWREGRLQWQVEGGAAWLEVPGRSVDLEDRQVYVPGRLVIEPNIDEAELLGRVVAGCQPSEQLALELSDPAAGLFPS